MGAASLSNKALGQFNIYNSLAIFSSLLASGYAAEQVIRVMAELKAAPGRMEIVANAPYVLVDYAHTPDALENVLTTLNQLKKGACGWFLVVVVIGIKLKDRLWGKLRVFMRIILLLLVIIRALKILSYCSTK